MLSPISKWIMRSHGPDVTSPDRAEERRLEKLRRVLYRARSGSSFYAERLAGVEPGSVTARSRLETLPLMTGADIREHALRMLCVPLNEVERIATVRSSGTTGEAKRIYFTRRDLERTADFFSAGMADVLAGADCCTIFMSGPTENSIARLLQEGLSRIGVTAKIHGNVKEPERAYLDICTGGGIVGLPGEMLYLCRSYPKLRPAAVLLSADYVPASVVRAIEEAWHCPVFTHYGMTETGYGLAVQCARREGMHIRSGEFIVEIIDPASGRACPPGEEGEIVITSLENEAMPLIRCRTGDTGALSAAPCGCGDALPALAFVRGRTENLGQRVNIHMLDELLFAMPAVRNYSAVLRRDVLELTVDTLPGGELGEKALAEALGMRVSVRCAALGPGGGTPKRRLDYEAP